MLRNPPLSGKKRSPFLSKNALFIELWRTATPHAPRRIGKKEFLTIEAFNDYIMVIDDTLDKLGHPDIDKDYLKYKTIPGAKKRISGFVKSVKGLDLTKEEKARMLKAAGEFRRTAFHTLRKFYAGNIHNLDNIIKMKEETSGETGRMTVRLLNITGRVPQEESHRVEDACTAAFMATQIADDIYDLREDMESGTPNIAFGILQSHPQELKHVMAMGRPSLKLLKEVCPQSTKQIMELYNGYLGKIPTTGDIQSIIIFPIIFMKLLSLTRRNYNTIVK